MRGFMKVKIEFNDINSFTREEAIDRVKQFLGKSTSIEVLPDTSSVEDILRFALSQMLGYEQLCILNDSPYEYADKIEILKKKILSSVESHLNSIILANEAKFDEV